jgi:hypothetical protein
MFTYEITIPGKGTYEVTSKNELSDTQAYEAALSQVQQEPQKGTARRTAEIVTRGALPPATMAATGAALGSVAGPPGAAIGALAGGVAIPVSDFLVSLYNLTQKEGVKLPSTAISEMLDSLGLARPESRGERMLEAGAGAVTGAGAQVPALARLATTATQPVVRGVAQQAAQAPAAQIATAAPAAATAQLVGEATGSPIAGLVAGTAVGAAPGVRPGRVEPGAGKAQLTSQAASAYRLADRAGLVVKDTYVQNMASTLRKEAADLGFDPGLHPKVAAVINRLESEGTSPKTLKELETLRRIVRSPEGDFTNPDQQRIAGVMVDKFDDLVENIGKPNILSGDDKLAISALKEARKVYGQSRRLGIIEDLVNKADISSGQYSQSGMDNALRVQFAALAKNNKRMAAFTPEERAQIENIAKGGGTGEQMLRFVGRFSVRGPVTGLATGGAVAIEPVIGGSLAIGAEASRRGAEALRQQNVQRLMEQISLGRTPESRAFELLPATTIRGLLSSQYGME